MLIIFVGEIVTYKKSINLISFIFVLCLLSSMINADSSVQAAGSEQFSMDAELNDSSDISNIFKAELN